MRDFNKVIILGNLTRDPEMRYTPNGQPVCSFGVATNRRWNDASGNTQEAVEFHNVVAWGKLAEICNQILNKGRKTLVEGRLQTRSWEGQDGVKRTKTEIVAENISALGAAGERNVPDAEAGAADQSPETEEKTEKKSSSKDKPEKAEKPNKTKSNPDEEINLDDIPF
ncbi:MAG TPA: single-stranded DNA-binding protein [Patescibacteria group bacterium]|nr:single-stranded DNA-binding protein [Patescibacteria group bacterium]